MKNGWPSFVFSVEPLLNGMQSIEVTMSAAVPGWRCSKMILASLKKVKL